MFFYPETMVNLKRIKHIKKLITVDDTRQPMRTHWAKRTFGATDKRVSAGPAARCCVRRNNSKTQSGNSEWQEATHSKKVLFFSVVKTTFRFRGVESKSKWVWKMFYEMRDKSQHFTVQVTTKTRTIPPINTWVISPSQYFPIVWITSAICTAISRVGAMINAFM